MSMPTCPSCVYASGICKKTGVEIRTTTGCTYHTPKPMTNADRIRSMSDEELVEFILPITECGRCPTGEIPCTGDNCRRTLLGWLREEAAENE